MTKKAVELAQNLKLILPNLKNLQILKQWREHRKHIIIIKERKELFPYSSFDYKNFLQRTRQLRC
jgi:hypothetical protein